MSTKPEVFDYLLEELDGARSSYFGMLSTALVFAGFIFLGWQIGSVFLAVYAGVAGLILAYLALSYSAYGSLLKSKLKAYLKDPEKYDLEAALHEIWKKEPGIHFSKGHKR